ncbi:serendipity locus protein alpha [Drosophila tropicalis]|uniref:serendipity locus protein alpha n=1 Tax=Drosophila tropicalis TaxID=46794 RepID=UPI0035AC00A5
MEQLLQQLNLCHDLIEVKGEKGKINWLNRFCATFLKFASEFKIYLPDVAPKYTMESSTDLHVETIFLCLTQVVTCITHLERIINIEEATTSSYLMTRQHFVDRILWCIRRLFASLSQLIEDDSKLALEDLTFVELMDLALDQLESHKEEMKPNGTYSVLPVEANEKKDDYELCELANHIVRHALAFANVALEPDKRALTTLCETLLSECMAFSENVEDQTPEERKLEALSLERALYSLEGLLNEALLRLVFVCLLDVEDTSVKRLKQILAECNDNSTVDQLINDFDIKMDRIQQIGVFAIAFSQDVKTKTIVRSCLASLESLDACIVPAFQLQRSATSTALHHANTLEHHFNEELQIFWNVLHEIIDSQSLVNNYLDMLVQKIHGATNEEHQKVVQMANVLLKHFGLAVNYEALDEVGKRLHNDFQLILRECKAILKHPIAIDPKRIMKRFKILYSILAKLRDVLGKSKNTEVFNGSCLESNLFASKRQRSFFKPHRSRQQNVTTTFNSANNDSELLSFQLTEILRIG